MVRGIRTIVLLTVVGFAFSGCDLLGDEDNSPEAIYPVYVDENGNGINDYVEAESHDAGPSSEARAAAVDGVPRGPAPAGHAFIDENNDGICHFAQDGSPTWHGPNFVDEDGNGRCDYWEPGGRGHGGRHGIGGGL